MSSEPQSKQFKRMNFFRGFYTTAEDWQAGQNYHLEKRKLHNRALHTPGVMWGITANLDVRAADKRTVSVMPGAALDAAGNMIYLSQLCTREIPAPTEHQNTAYVMIKFAEQLTDHVNNTQDPEYSGDTRVTEEPCVKVAFDRPDNLEWLELARIALQSTDAVIVDPLDPAMPQMNEIDRRFVPRAGAVDPALAAVRERMRRLHEYHLERQKRHNRGLHTPGVLHGIPDWRTRLTEFTVLPDSGLTVQVGAGAALDRDGNEIYLDQPCKLTLTKPQENTRFYIAVRYEDHFADYLADLERPFGGTYCTAQLTVTTDKPTGSPWVALARIDLTADAVEIREPADPVNPQPNEIDRRVRRYSDAVGLAPARLDPALQKRLMEVMQTTRQHFAALAGRFPTPSLEDVRYGALHLQMSAATIEPNQLWDALKALAAVEQSCEHELGDKKEKYYPALPSEQEFVDYQAALNALSQALSDNQQPFDPVLDRQQAVANAALVLSKVVFPPPSADAGDDRTVQATDDEAQVTLDASRSKPGIGRKVVKYRWEKV